MEWAGRMNSIRSRTDAGLCPASPCGWNTMGQQKVHEYEAPGSHGAGEPGGLIEQPGHKASRARQAAYRRP